MRSIRTIISILIHLQVNSLTCFLWNKPGHTAIHYRHIETRFTTHKHIISLSLLTFTWICKLRISSFFVSSLRIYNRRGAIFIRVSGNWETTGFSHRICIDNLLGRIIASSPATITVRSKTLINTATIFEVRENHFFIL